LYKEDFENFKEALEETTNYIIDKKGEEVISDRHQKDFTKPSEENSESYVEATLDSSATAFTNVNFDDI
jgi:hypothetical protein